MIRPATRADEDAIWSIFHAVVAPGDTYVFDPQTLREEALAYWFRPDTHTYVAEGDDGQVVGTYILKPNQPALGSHVANAAFMVSPAARGSADAWASTALPRRAGSGSARCNSILWFRRTRRRCDSGNSSVSRLSAPCRGRFDTPGAALSMLT